MKKINLIIALSMALCGQAMAQVQFGVKAGTTLSNYIFTGSFAEDEKSSTLVSFYAGATVDIPVNEVVTLQTGLSLIGKGAREDRARTGSMNGVSFKVSSKGKVAPLYLEVPLTFSYNFNVGKGKLAVGAGPYYALGIAGRYKYKYEESTIGQGINDIVMFEEDENIEFGNTENDNLRRHDFGLNGLVAYQFTSHIGLQAGYSMGLTSVSPNRADENQNTIDLKTKNSVISAGLFYKF